MEYPAMLNLLAAIVEQAKSDQLPSRYGSKCHGALDVEFPHHPRTCAYRFLVALNMKLNEGTPMSITELALVVAEVIE